jgi:integrase
MALAELRKQVAVGRAFDDWDGLQQLVAPKNKKTFAEAAEAYMQEKALKPSTTATYQDILKTHLLPQFGALELRKVTEEMIAQFQADLRRKDLSPRRVNTIIQVLSSILRVSVRRKVIKENPADNVDRVQEPKADIDPLSREELELALASVDPYFRPLFTCLAWTGARPNELLALRWRDVDWRRGDFRINKGRVRGEEGLPKTKSAERYIPMLPPVVEALRELEQRPLKHVDDYIFMTKRGEPINKHLDRIWSRALKRAGLRHRASYQLRHTFASLALERGASPGWVSKILGHSSMEITFRYYVRFIKDASSENERLMASMFEHPTGLKVVGDQKGDHLSAVSN